MQQKIFLNFNGHLKMIAILIITTAAIINGISANINDNEVKDDIYMYMGVQVYEVERECAMVGGLCVHKSDCLEITSKSGLCPKNQFRGVECCYELPVREAPCSQHGGECMKLCSRFAQRPGNDCPDGQMCCALLQ